MKVLFDQGTPAPLRKFLRHHIVATVYEIGWSTLENGYLIRSAQKEGYDVFVTTDQNLKYQQNLEDRKIAILVLLSTSRPRILRVVDSVIAAVEPASPGSYSEIAI